MGQETKTPGDPFARRSAHDRGATAPSDPRSPERREALKRIGRSLGALAVGSLVLSGAGCAPLVDPSAITRLPLADIPQGRKMILHADRRVELRRAGDTVTARLMVCTHEFCDLTWYEVEDNYRCTCHDGRFFPDGRPKSGPVSRPMFVLPARIDDDTLIIGPAGEIELTS